MKLLDTTFLIHTWAGTNETEAYLTANEDSHRFVTTTINLKEIAVGRELQGKFDHHEIETTFEWVDIVPFDRTAAYMASTLEADLRRQDSINQDKINSLAADVLIGAVARNLDAPVVTENVEDFEMLDGVETEAYR